MTSNSQDCSKCGKKSPDEALFCQHCGQKFKDKSSQKPGLNHRHIIYTIIIVFMAEMILSFIAALGWYIYYPEAMENMQLLVRVADAGAFAGVFSGALFAAYRFAEKSGKEVAAGAVSAILISRIADISVTGSWGIEALTGTLLLLITALAGIGAGLLLLKKNGRS